LHELTQNPIHIKLLVFFLAIAFFAQTFSKGLIVANYYANTSAYAKNCINKVKPQMHCNGKCQLMKKLKQEENKDSQNPERKNDLKIDLLFFSQNKQPLLYIPCLIENSFAQFQHQPTKDAATEIFHPPSQV
jgi:hypothetical protein